MSEEDKEKFFQCIRKGKLDEVKKLLTSGNVQISDKERNYPKSTALNVACSEGKIKIVKLLKEMGCDVDGVDMDGWTPLLCACDLGHLDVVEFLVDEAGVDVTHESLNGETALHRASISGNLKIIKFLVSKGCDIFKKNNEGETPITLAEDKKIKSYFKKLMILESEKSGMTVQKFQALKQHKTQSIEKILKLENEIEDLQKSRFSALFGGGSNSKLKLKKQYDNRLEKEREKFLKIITDKDELFLKEIQEKDSWKLKARQLEKQIEAIKHQYEKDTGKKIKLVPMAVPKKAGDETQKNVVEVKKKTDEKTVKKVDEKTTNENEEEQDDERCSIM